MNDDSRAVSETYDYAITDQAAPDAEQGSVQLNPVVAPAIPDYLQNTYSWAYLHPRSFWFFEREWVVNLILWGQYEQAHQCGAGGNGSPAAKLCAAGCLCLW